MKKRQWITIMLFAITLLIVGCSNNENSNENGHNHGDHNVMAEPIHVEISVDPTAPQVGQAVKIVAKVTQDGKPVTKADEVKFEVWASGEDDHEMIDGSHTENGIYVIEKTFAESGTYFAVSHVTYGAMHSMPKLEFAVGE